MSSTHSDKNVAASTRECTPDNAYLCICSVHTNQTGDCSPHCVTTLPHVWNLPWQEMINSLHENKWLKCKYGPQCQSLQAMCFLKRDQEAHFLWFDAFSNNATSTKASFLTSASQIKIGIIWIRRCYVLKTNTTEHWTPSMMIGGLERMDRQLISVHRALRKCAASE